MGHPAGLTNVAVERHNPLPLRLRSGQALAAKNVARMGHPARSSYKLEDYSNS
jgi:hypothetical protein